MRDLWLRSRLLSTTALVKDLGKVPISTVSGHTFIFYGYIVYTARFNRATCVNLLENTRIAILNFFVQENLAGQRKRCYCPDKGTSIWHDEAICPHELWFVFILWNITSLQASDSTVFEWCPDGQHFMTATTSPRLREGNGYVRD